MLDGEPDVKVAAGVLAGGADAGGLVACGIVPGGVVAGGMVASGAANADALAPSGGDGGFVAVHCLAGVNDGGGDQGGPGPMADHHWAGVHGRWLPLPSQVEPPVSRDKDIFLLSEVMV